VRFYHSMDHSLADPREIEIGSSQAKSNLKPRVISKYPTPNCHI
jgi:hypothetical protein